MVDALLHRLADCGKALTFAARRLIRRPALLAAAAGTLAIAIGATVAIFQLVDSALLRPLDLHQPEELFTVQHAVRGVRGTEQRVGMTWARAQRFRNDKDLGEAVAVVTTAADRASTRIPLEIGASHDVVDGRFVSGNFFETLGVSSFLGRTLTPADDSEGSEPVAVITYGLWQSAFGANRAVVGSLVRVKSVPVMIVGVLPQRFRGVAVDSTTPAMFFPLMAGPRLASGPATNGAGNFSISGTPAFQPSIVSPLADFQAIVRLDRAHVQRAQVELEAVAGADWKLVSLTDTLLPFAARTELRRFLALLAGTVGLIVLIGSTNLAGLLLARTEERRAELAVCSALGAGRFRLACDAASEAVILSTVGAALAVGVAGLVLRLMGTFALPGGVTIASLPIAVDMRAIAMGAAVTALVAILVGLAPTMRAAGSQLAPDLTTLTASLRRFRGLRILVAVQVAISLALVFLAVLFVRTMSHALTTDLGFDRSQMVGVSTVAPAALGESGPSRIEAMLAEVRSLPGVTVATIGSVPMIRGTDVTSTNIRIDGAPPNAALTVEVVYAAEDYFRTLRQPILRGREFGIEDRADGVKVAVVNQAAASLFWKGQDPVGHRIGFAYMPTYQLAYEVVGVAADVKFGTLRDSARPVVYFSRAQHRAYLAGYLAGSERAHLIVRSGLATATLAPLLVRAVTSNGLETESVTSLGDQIGRLLMPQRLGRFLLLLFAFVACILSFVGIYGLAACIGTQSRREIGIRCALGATSNQVLQVLATRVVLPVVWGLLAGVGLSVLSARFVGTFLYAESKFPVASLAAVMAGVLAVSVVVTMVPLWRAKRISPAEILRT